MAQTVKKAALYVRVSTDAQAEEGYSIAAQSEKLRAYCSVKDIPSPELFVDGGFSGSNLERPEMRRLIEEAGRGLLSHVIVYKLDRLSRSQKDTLYLIEDVFIPNDIAFVSINENIDTASPYGRAMIGILSAFAQLERENIYMRTRMGMLERVRAGFWPGGGTVPFGYDYDRKKGCLVPNEDAETVRRIYELYIGGWSAQRIADATGLKYDRLVTQILTRRSNLGVIVYKGEEYEGLHEPLVSRETYELAMEKMRERSRARADSRYHLLTGIVYCGECGARMRYQRWGSGGFMLYCYSHDRSRPHMVRDAACPSPPVPAEEVEDVVLRDLLALPVKMEEAEQAGKTPPDPAKLLEEREAQLRARLRRLFELYADSDSDVLRETIADTERRLEDIRAALERERALGTERKRRERLLGKLDGLGGAWEHMTPRERQAVVRDCVERVVVSGEKVEVYYTFAGETASASVSPGDAHADDHRRNPPLPA